MWQVPVSSWWNKTVNISLTRYVIADLHDYTEFNGLDDVFGFGKTLLKTDDMVIIQNEGDVSSLLIYTEDYGLGITTIYLDRYVLAEAKHDTDWSSVTDAKMWCESAERKVLLQSTKRVLSISNENKPEPKDILF